MPIRLIAAPHTPMHEDGRFNDSVIQRYARHLAESGVDGVFVAGSTGESHSLTVAERKRLAERWIEARRTCDLEVIIQVGHNCQADAVELGSHAASIDADAIAALAPSYFKPATVDDLIDFCAPIAAAAGDAPFYYYDIPTMTGVRLSMVDFLTRGPKQIPNLAGIKYTNMDLAQLQECLHLDDGRFEILFGCDEALLAAYALGVRGAVGSTYNFAASLYRNMIAAYDAGDRERAQQLQAKSVELVRALQASSIMAASKFLMSTMGVDCGPVRPPLRNISPAEKDELRARIQQLELPARGLREPPARIEA
jgi:N-acetylneuraminate lyase